MSNALTGNYEAVVQISTRAINGLLATMHQNGLAENAPLKLVHSTTLRVGDSHPSDPGTFPGDFAEWVQGLQVAQNQNSLADLHSGLKAAVPPGAAKMLEDAFSELGHGPRTPPPGSGVRGTVQVQVAPPTLSLPTGSTTEVILGLSIRADYKPDPGTLNVVAPGHYVHGEVHATFEVTVTTNPRDHRTPRRYKLVIQASPQDAKIYFVPAAGSNLTATEVDQISAQVRKALRESITTAPVDLPSGFPFTAYKGLGSGANQALAVPLQLSNATAPAGGIQGVNTLFTGPAGFALAVSQEFVKSVFKATTDHLKQFTQDISVDIPLWPDPTYHVTVSDAFLQFNPGWIDLIVHAKAHTGNALPPVGFSHDYNITITQKITLILFINVLVIIARDDGLTVGGLPSQAVGTVKSAIAVERSNLLPQVQDNLNTTLQHAKTQFTSALQSFDSHAQVSFRSGTTEDANAGASGAIAITPDGVIIRGDFGSSAARPAPVVSITETRDHSGFTALDSWIPGGRVEQMVWSWVEYFGLMPTVWSGVEKSATVEQSFIFPKPPGITQVSSICLRVQGTKTQSGGEVISGVTGGTTCHLPDFGTLMESPSWWEPVTMPIWRPNTAQDAVLKDSLAGHVSVQGAKARKDQLTHNTLVYFADWKKEKPLEPLAKALSQMQRKSYSLMVVVVTPAGTFDGRRKEVEAKLEMGGKHFPVLVLPTEDNEGGWTRTFAARKTPSVFLVNARGAFVWKHAGEVDPKELAAALDQHLVPAAAPQSQPLRLGISHASCQCTGAPDIVIQDDLGDHFALHRMLGQEVLLNFWQAWSAPSIKELVRLQALQKSDPKNAPYIVGFHGGKDQKAVEKIRKQHGLTFPLMQDTDQRIARKYGIRCWPTTISVNADGHIGHVQFGVAHDHKHSADDKTAQAP